MNPGFWSNVVWLVIAYVCSVALTVAIGTVGKPAGLTLELQGSQEGPARDQARGTNKWIRTGIGSSIWEQGHTEGPHCSLLYRFELSILVLCLCEQPSCDRY